ncbi:ankyrin repeat-containing protein At5g02620-like isoform X2 [Tripterygium wilfordii]|nr:ankyrin repeat-containing protein At5g02620-like isoform X2 [Tripterygium wilfordii]
MIEAENNYHETPLHEACRRGAAEMVKLLMAHNPWVATKLNRESHSAFFLACREGHLNVVELMASQSWLMEFEEEATDSTPVHAAIMKGHFDVAKRVLEVCPNFAQKTNRNGLSPLHYAASRGHLKITKLLLSLDPDLALQYSNDGYTPLHLAVINGSIAILEVFMASSPNSFQNSTEEGQTVCHLAVKFNKYDTFKYLGQGLCFSNIFSKQDQHGNAVLHLAVLRGNPEFVKYIIRTKTVGINIQNHQGCTALDLLELAGSHEENNQIIRELLCSPPEENNQIIGELLCSPPEENNQIIGEMLYSPHEERNIELSRLTKESPSGQSRNDLGIYSEVPINIGCRQRTSRENLLMHQSGMNVTNTLVRNKHLSKSCADLSIPVIPPNSSQNLLEPESKETSEIVVGQETSEPELLNEAKDLASQLRQHNHLSERRREELSMLFKYRQNQQNEIHREALLNARNTIILSAILIATVTFAAGLNPPGGVYQEGPLKGKSTVGRTKAFKIFTISNNIALFTSLCIVIVLVSIIPFRRKQLMKLLTLTHKVMWVSLAFLATAFVAGTWIITPHRPGTEWTFEATVAVGGGTMGTVFVYLGVSLARHWLRKLKWRKEHPKKKRNESKSQQAPPTNLDAEAELYSDSYNSDLDSSKSLGYHTY